MTWQATTGWLFAAAGLLSLAGCHTTASGPALQSVDTLIVGGTVYDGSGAAGRQADIAVDGERIVFLGQDARLRFSADRVIDATGLVVAPGFIDMHTHAGSDLASGSEERRANLPYLFQGVTTVMVGNDGAGRPDIAATASAAGAGGIGTNVAYLVGFGPVREEAIGKADRAPVPEELERMKATVRAAMCEGAWGFSAGLYYVPQAYAETEEVIALARVASKLGGYYDTHLRDESTYNIGVTGAVREATEIGKIADIPVHIAHIKALGPAVWGHSAKMIEAIERAQAEGQRITADQYPWTASGTRVSAALVPRWALEGGLERLRERLADGGLRARIRTGMIAGLKRRGGADKLLVTGRLGDANAEVGATLAEIAHKAGLEPVDAAIAILAAGDARVASFNMSADDIKAFAERDWVATGSDGSTGHPRKYASFPKAYRDFVVESETMSLARFIRRSSGFPADIVGLPGRGYIRVDHAADIVIFDPAVYEPRATYQSPRVLSVGVRHLLVNGVPVVTDGKYTGVLPGTPLLKDTRC